MKLRSSSLPGGLLAALCLLILGACDSGTIALPVQPTPRAVWAPPTPFPPVQYPTEVATPGLPPALEDKLPSGVATGQAQYAPVQGKLAQQLLEIEQDAAKVR